MTKENIAHEGCVFFDPRTGECRRLRRLSDSSQMEIIRTMFRRWQISDALMFEITTEINRPPSAAKYTGDQRDGWLACTASVRSGHESSRPDVVRQIQCDGYIGADGQQGARSPMTPQVAGKIKLLLPPGA